MDRLLVMGRNITVRLEVKDNLSSRLRRSSQLAQARAFGPTPQNFPYRFPWPRFHRATPGMFKMWRGY